MGSSSGVNDQALNIRHVSQQRKDLQLIDKIMSFPLAALDIKCKDRSAAVRKVLFLQSVIRMIGQRRMIDLFDLRMLG